MHRRFWVECGWETWLLPITEWPWRSMRPFWPCFPFCKIEKRSVPTSQSSVKIWGDIGEQWKAQRNWSVKKSYSSILEIGYQNGRNAARTVGLCLSGPCWWGHLPKMPRYWKGLMTPSFQFPRTIAFCSCKKQGSNLLWSLFFKWGNWAQNSKS